MCCLRCEDDFEDEYPREKDWVRGGKEGGLERKKIKYISYKKNLSWKREREKRKREKKKKKKRWG